MRSYVVKEIGKHTCTVVFLAGILDYSLDWVQFFMDYQKQGVQPHAAGTRFILPQAPLRNNGTAAYWYDPGPVMPKPAGGLYYDTSDMDESVSTLKALIAHEHVINKVPLERIVSLGFSHGAGLSLYATLRDMIFGVSETPQLSEASQIMAAPRFPTGAGPRGPNVRDPFEKLPEAMMLRNYNVDLTKLAYTSSFASRMAGVGVLAFAAATRGCAVSKNIPRLYIFHGVRDTVTPIDYHHASMDYVRKIYESCGADMNGHVQLYNKGPYEHQLPMPHVMNLSRLLSKSLDIPIDHNRIVHHHNNHHPHEMILAKW